MAEINTPNKLTLIRIALIVPLMFFLLSTQISHNYLYALLIFSIASLTDLLDGHLARKNNDITTFGKFLDPLADKLLIMTAFVCFIELGLTSAVVVIIVLTREFLVTSVRLIASERGEVISASFWGKAKTISQMVAVILVLVLQESVAFGILRLPVSDIILFGNIAIYISCAFTVISGAQYLWVNRKFWLQDR